MALEAVSPLVGHGFKVSTQDFAKSQSHKQVQLKCGTAGFRRAFLQGSKGDSRPACRQHRSLRGRSKAAVSDDVAQVEKKPSVPSVPPGRKSVHAKETKVVVEERLFDGQVRRYTFVGSKSSVDIVESSHRHGDESPGSSPASSGGSSTVMRVLKETFLPAGYPDSVTKDYTPYMRWSIPVHILGHACNTLVTSSLLKAVNVDANGVAVGAATAAIRWVTKDGVGAVGRAVIGGRFGNLPDEDPRQWRMYANFITTFGSALELATPLAPGHFLLLASMGHLCRAVGRGMKNPCFKVVQMHFALRGNLGNVAAKEDVWEVPSELIGLATGIALLNNFAKDYWSIVGCWTIGMAAHLTIRYKSLSVLEFQTLSYKRAAAIINMHVAGKPLPDYATLSTTENLCTPRYLCQPQLEYGVSVVDLVAALGGPQQVGELLDAYEGEDYVLLCTDGVLPIATKFQVVLKEGAESQAFLRSMYQAAWLLHAESSNSLGAQNGHGKLHSSIRSLKAMQASFESFRTEAQEQGYDVDKVLYQLPMGTSMVARK